MPKRLAACEPCREAKVSCDHTRPTCRRCVDSNEFELCVYRDRPFKRRRTTSTSVQQTQTPEPVDDHLPEHVVTTSSKSLHDSPTASTSALHVYPNPGYQGLSSHTTIFDTVKASGGSGNFALSKCVLHEAIGDLEEAEVVQHTKFLDDLRRRLDLNACAKLITQWLSSGVNLAIAGPLVMPCTEAVCLLFQSQSGAELASFLLRNSRERLTTDGTTSIATFYITYCQNNPGWATLGLFLVALCRAVQDTAYFSPLYTTRSSQRQLQKTFLRCADQCLEICLSLDCLNDLQLVLQYENFIAHSMIDGDQSFHSWRRLGDVVSSLYALGHHERVDLASLISGDLRSLRSQTCARAFSADKNISIFLGRPYRMHSTHSTLKMSRSDIDSLFSACYSLASTNPFDYTIETTWTVACALLKERVLDLVRVEDPVCRKAQSNGILLDCEALLAALPHRYRLTDHLKTFEGNAVERDFVASAALNLLHVRFLLHSVFMTKTSEPSEELLGVSGSMLKLAAEVAVLQRSLANSGTGFIWKVRMAHLYRIV